jgi:hypothetical protein
MLMKLRSWLLSTWFAVVGAFVSTRTKKAPQTALAAEPAELPGDGWATTRTGAAGPDLDGEAAFADWLDKALRAAPNQAAYGRTYLDSAAAVVRWRRRYRGNPKLWNRLMKDKVVKELIECAPVVAACRDYVDAHTTPVTVVDLCSGKGYLAMLLSELLPKDKVSRIVLVDKAWPLNGQDEPLPHQINWDHIYDYYEDWPTTLTTSKQDLKCKSSVRGMKRRILDEAPGDIVVLAVHLCGTLSLKALDLFNSHEKCSFLVLKPCCLPGLVHSKRDEVFVVGDHSFDSKEVCSNGRFKGNVWKGPPRHLIRGKFERWARNLEQGAKLRGDGVRRLENITVQTEGGFQNAFIFAEHEQATAPLWDGLARRGRMPA